jgi:hypothetical protein
MTQILSLPTATEAGTIATPIPSTTNPELGEPRCPNGHDSATPPQCPALMLVACHHYKTEATWNEFCIVCGIRHAPFRIYWRSYRMDEQGVRSAKNYCGYCGARVVSGRASRWTRTMSYPVISPNGFILHQLRQLLMFLLLVLAGIIVVGVVNHKLVPRSLPAA